jgi:O-antigen ligase
MRWIALALILASIPLLIAFLQSGGTKRRDLAVLCAGGLMFCTGPLELAASPIVWPMWQGYLKGVTVSVLDAIAIALLMSSRARFQRPPFLLLIALFAIPIVLSWPLAPAKQPAFFAVFQIAQMTIYFIALAGELQRATAIKSLMKGLAVGLMIQAGYVIWQKMGGVVQASGTVAHQNILGIMVELSLLPLVAAVFEGEKNKLVYAGILSGLLVIAGGGSRGSMVFLTLGLVIFLILTFARRPTRRKTQLLGFVLVATTAAVPVGIMTLEDRFGESSLLTEEPQRAAFERAARAMAADHPLGVGANNFVSVNNVQGYAAQAGLDWSSALRSKPAHNAYLVARAETGWAGQISLLLLISGIVIAGIRTGFRRRNVPYVGLALGSASAIAAVAIHSNYEYAFYFPEVQRLFFMNAALVAACRTFAQQASRRSLVAQRNSRGGPQAA